MDLSTLVKMSNTYGSNPAYVLAGGGNTSVKDDTTLYVKGSGTQLATIKSEEFVEMSRARLNEIMKTDYPEDDVKRESLYLADVMAAVTDDDKTKRPSVEALLHNLFAYTYVLHVHPTLVNGLTCGKGAKELSEQLLGKDVLWINICKPGYTLARICYEKMNAYKEESGKDVQVLLLQNHGIFVAANTVEEIGVLFDGVISKLEKQVKRTADVSDAVTSEKEQAAEKLSRLLGHAVEVVPVAEADNFVKDKAAAAPLLKPFTPDHIVYCGPYPLFVEDIDQAKAALDSRAASPCTGCNYCVDMCPNKIAIPYNFRAYNMGTLYDDMELAKDFYQNEVTSYGRRADSCTSCGSCAPSKSRATS